MLKKAPEILLNILFWLISYYLTIQLFAIETIDIQEIHDGSIIRKVSYNDDLVWSIRIGFMLKMAYYYINVYVISRYFRTNHWLPYLKYLLPLLAIFFAAEIFKISRIQEIPIMWIDSFFVLILQYTIVTLISIAHLILLRSAKQDVLKQQLQKEKVSAELRALKAQINPHFLFNALNNLLSITDKAQNYEASTVVTELSDMMRFLLDDVEKEKIPVQKEIEFIENYIRMNKLRFDDSDDIDIQFHYTSGFENIYMEPALLIPFVENAFKYGIHIFKKSRITMRLNLGTNGNIQFYIENTIHEETNKDLGMMKSTGVGLKNVKKRLQLAYPDKHVLEISNRDKLFVVDLKIQNN